MKTKGSKNRNGPITFIEIAARLNMPVKTVEAQFHRGMRKIKAICPKESVPLVIETLLGVADQPYQYVSAASAECRKDWITKYAAGE